MRKELNNKYYSLTSDVEVVVDSEVATDTKQRHPYPGLKYISCCHHGKPVFKADGINRFLLLGIICIVKLSGVILISLCNRIYIYALIISTAWKVIKHI